MRSQCILSAFGVRFGNFFFIYFGLFILHAFAVRLHAFSVHLRCVFGDIFCHSFQFISFDELRLHAFVHVMFAVHLNAFL